MLNFSYYSPTKVIFGKDVELGTAGEIKKFGGSRVLIIYGGGSVIKSGLLAKIQQSLTHAGLAFTTLGGVQPNPRLSLAREGVQKGIDFGADFILAVGGGSVIDTAKGVAHGIANPGTDIWRFWLRELEVTRSLPVGAVLTISAAGSETSDSAVLTDDATWTKRALSTEFNRPRFVVMNPELTYTLPKYQITCGIVDIMMHTLDRYFTPVDGNEIAEALLRVVIKNGRIAVENQEDYEAASELMWCGSLSHNGITGLGAKTDFATHQLGHELSGKFDVAHGASLSAMWGSWALYTYQEKPERFARYGNKVWGIETADPVQAAQEAIEQTVAYFASIDMPTCFGELGAGIQSDEVLQDLADRCVFQGARTIGQFKVLDRSDVYEIYKLANH